LRRTIHELEAEKESLRNTMRDMVEDYTKQLEIRDENIRKLEEANFSNTDGYKLDAAQLRDQVS
jgi:hypothetical protein